MSDHEQFVRHSDGCQVWTGPVDTEGRPRLRGGNAARILYAQAGRPTDVAGEHQEGCDGACGVRLMSECGNALCVAPEHRRQVYGCVPDARFVMRKASTRRGRRAAQDDDATCSAHPTAGLP